MEPKLGKLVWRVRNEPNRDGSKEYVFVGVQRHRIVAWDQETICADAGGQGDAGSALYYFPRPSWFESEQEATNAAHNLAKELEASGKTVRTPSDLKPATN